MNKVLRFFAVLLLALTVPVQGLAAITAGQCMTFGHHQQDAAGHESPIHPQDTDGHEQSAHTHENTGSGQGAQDGKGPHCGPCAACCASASIAGPTIRSLVSSASEAPYILSQCPPAGVALRGVDRPPLAL